MTPETPRRADAQRNREALLTATRNVLAQRGLSASMDEIARTAGLGAGTLYRHFPDRDQLFSAVAIEVTEEGLAVLESATLEPDASTSLYDTLRVMASRFATNRVLSELISESTTPEVVEGNMRAVELLGELVTRAQAADDLREDVSATDLVFLIRAIARIRIPDAPPDIWQRYFDLIIDGLHPNAAHPLSKETPDPLQ